MHIILNPMLVEQQGLTVGEICELEMLHAQREVLFERMSLLDPTRIKDMATLEANVAEVQRLEFAMQKTWRFDQDADFHSWWFRTPHCTCPANDNWELVGSDARMISQKCPLHK